MNSSDHPSAYGYRPHNSGNVYNSAHHYGGNVQKQPWQPTNEETLLSSSVVVERKIFVLTLKENPRGRFLRITEKGGMKQQSIIVPSTGLHDFQKLLAEMVASEPTAAPAKPASSESGQP